MNSVLKQVEEASKNRVGFFIGVMLGGLIPIATFCVSHFEIAGKSMLRPETMIVLGGLVFSAITVYQWTTLAFQSKAKAIGFILLAEGTMILSNIEALSYAALAYLVVINAVATACNLVLDHREKANAGRKEKRKVYIYG